MVHRRSFRGRLWKTFSAGSFRSTQVGERGAPADRSTPRAGPGRVQERPGQPEGVPGAVRRRSITLLLSAIRKMGPPDYDVAALFNMPTTLFGKIITDLGIVSEFWSVESGGLRSRHHELLQRTWDLKLRRQVVGGRQFHRKLFPAGWRRTQPRPDPLPRDLTAHPLTNPKIQARQIARIIENCGYRIIPPSSSLE